jgi:hypothetical protein
LEKTSGILEKLGISLEVRLCFATPAGGARRDEGEAALGSQNPREGEKSKVANGENEGAAEARPGGGRLGIDHSGAAASRLSS